MQGRYPAQQTSHGLSQQHRILIYTTCYNLLDGVTLTIRKIEQVLLEAGHHVFILTTKSGNIKNTHMDGEHPNRSVVFIDDAIPLAHSIDPNNHDNTYYLGFSLSKYVRAKIEEFEPTLVHITVPDCTCLHLIDYARRKELPLMGTYHSNIPEYMNHYPGLGWLKYILEAFFRHQYNFLQSLYVPTPFIRKQLTQSLRMERVTNLQVWGRGIDLERFSPRHRSKEFRSQLGLTDKDVLLLWVGRLVPEKRPDIFIEVVRRLNAKKIPFKALVVGAGPSEEAVKALPNTTFAGWMNGDELATAYASSDVFLFPSAVETFGNVSLEAAASGLPIVVEEGCGGHLVQHGVSGFACDQHDIDGFFNSVLCLVLDDKRRKEMSVQGRKLSTQYEKRTVCERMIENYSTVTNEFYTEYGGHHANRDAAYQKEHSFSSGNTPRPLLLIFVESLFIVLIRVWYRMTVLFMYLREKLVFVSPESGSVSQGQRNPLVMVKFENVQVQSAEIEEVPPIAEIDDLKTDAIAFTASQELNMLPTVVEDDESESTSTSSISEAPFYPHPDLHLSHRLSIGFVLVLQFFLRMESRVRSSSSRILSGKSSWKSEGRKRKNTQETFEEAYDEPFANPQTIGREERLNLRRSSVVVSNMV